MASRDKRASVASTLLYCLGDRRTAFLGRALLSARADDCRFAACVVHADVAEMYRNRQLWLTIASVAFRSGSRVAQSLAMAAATDVMEDRVRGSLWALFAGDALSSPTHWYYGGKRQIIKDYGGLLEDYKKPTVEMTGSIMAKSNTDGAGRGSYNPNKETIIGDVINHGKKAYWSPQKSYHYHATLEAGENTLEAQLARVLMRSITETGGSFSAEHFRKAYITFMTTPGSHNDAYASTCHRMFFANLVHNKLDPEECPDNDEHNVDTIDGLVLPTITALAEAYVAPDDTRKSREIVRRRAADTVRVTRNSRALEVAASTLSDSIFDAVRSAKLNKSSVTFFMSDDPMVSCYLSESLPSTLYMTSKYQGRVWDGLLANANVGGENVHRGAVLGAILGALDGATKLPTRLIDGLHAKEELSLEIDAFLNALQVRKSACAS